MDSNEKIDLLEAEIETLKEQRKAELASDIVNRAEVKRYTSEIKDLNAELKQQVKLQTEAAEALAEEKSKREDTVSGLKAHIEALTGIKDKSKDFNHVLSEMSEKYKKIEEVSGDSIKEIIKNIGEQVKATKKANKALKGTTKGSEEEKEAKAALSLETAKLAALQEELEAATGGLSKTLGDVVGDLDIYGRAMKSVKSIANKFIESTMVVAAENESARASFNASTGAAGRYDSELANLERGNRNLGISMAEHAESYTALIAGVSGFGRLAKSTRRDLSLLTSKFSKLGVASADMAGIMQTTFNMIGGTGGVSTFTTMTEEARQLAGTLDRDVASVISELNQALPRLATYGSNVSEMFEELQHEAHKTGIAVGELMDIAGNYRTFDAAATAAGNLNAVLRTQTFSTMDLLESQLEGPAAVAKYMREQIQGASESWDAMDTFQKEALANAAGMTTQQLGMLMNERQLTEAQQDSAKGIEEALAAGRGLWQEIILFAKQFAITAGPAIKMITGLFQGLNKIMQENRVIVEGIGYAFAAMTGAAAIGGLYKLMKFTKTMYGLLKSELAIRTAISVVRNPLVALGMVGLTAGVVGAVMTDTTAYASGTPSTLGGPTFLGEEGEETYISPDGSLAAIVGSNGPEFHPEMPRGAEIINNTTTNTMLNRSNAAASGGNGAGSADNTAVVAAVRALGSKMDTMISKLGVGGGDVIMQVNKREFGRVINEHFGEDGYQPLQLRTT